MTAYASSAASLTVPAELRLERAQVLGVDGDAGALHRGEDADERQLDVAQQRGRGLRLELGVERVGELEHGAGPQHVGLRGGGVLAAVEPERELAVVVALGAQLAPEVAQRQVGQVVAALVRHGEVGRQRGVAGDAGQLPAARREGQRRPLRVVQRLGRRLVGEPGGDRLLVLLVQRLGGEPGALAVVGRERDAGDVAGAGAPVARHVHAGAAAGPRVRSSQGATWPAPRTVKATSKPSSASGLAASTVWYSRSRSTRNSSASKTWCTSSRSQLVRRGRRA